MKLWHDDVRPPPPGWEWARTNLEAQALLLSEDVDEASLDHDLGLEDVDPRADPEAVMFAGPSDDGSGYDLVAWMCDQGICPPKVTVHSWNPDGALRMARRLAERFPDRSLSVRAYEPTS